MHTPILTPVFAWAIRTPDGSLLFDHITGAPWISGHRGHSVSDCEVAIIPRAEWDTLIRHFMADMTEPAPAVDLAEPVQTSLIPREIQWANDLRIRVSVQPILTDDGVLQTIALRIGASAGWMTDPHDMLLLSAEITPVQMRLAIDPNAHARHAVDAGIRAILDAIRDAYVPATPSKIVLAP